MTCYLQQLRRLGELVTTACMLTVFLITPNISNYQPQTLPNHGGGNEIGSSGIADEYSKCICVCICQQMMQCCKKLLLSKKSCMSL